jgi:hypothetical protein
MNYVSFLNLITSLHFISISVFLNLTTSFHLYLYYNILVKIPLSYATNF